MGVIKVFNLNELYVFKVVPIIIHKDELDKVGIGTYECGHS